MKEKSYLTIQEASQFLGYKKNYLYKLICLKEIPYLKYGSRVLFDMEDLRLWKQSRITRYPSKNELNSEAAIYAASRQI